MLLYFGITPYLVFDGDDLPSKSGTESDRHQRRQQSKALGLELQRKGRMAEAYQEFQKAVDVTPYMARQLIEELKKMNVQYVVAPYEADAQLVYLERHGMIDGIISEDSDLLVFGAQRLLSKLDQHGDFIEINRANFTACREVSLIGWTDADFRRMCILSGCDYLPNIARLGLKTAYRCIRKYKNVEKALRMLQFEGQYRVPADYLDNFKQAELTFLYQRVFCPKAGKLVTLTPPGEGVNLEELPYIGGDVEADIAVGVARGDLDPTTKEPIVLKPLAPGRPALGIQRRQTLGSSAELKPKSNKPISTFFTPKRMPLAELDPNSLSPSPSQQRLLERYANSSWDSSPAPAGPNAARSAPSLRRSQTTRVSSPLARSAERSSFLSQASKASTFQPAKRQRLCAEAEEETLPTHANCRSRFFVHKDGESSPSRQKSMKSDKARKSTIGVFSDDSAEDIMSELPDPTQQDESTLDEIDTPCKTADQREAGLVAPTSATPVAELANEGQKEESLANATASEITIPEDTVPEPTPEISVSADSNNKTFHQVLNYHGERQNKSILSKFAFKPGDSPSISRKPSLGASRAQSPRTSPAGLLLGPRRSPTQRQRSTPLQRLGQSALSRSRSVILPGSRTVPPPPTFSTCSAENQHLDAPKIPGAQGSEDMIIPDSEDESEDDTDDSGASKGPVSLDLKLFSFTASGTD